MKIYRIEAEKKLLEFLQGALEQDRVYGRFLKITPREEQKNFVSGQLFESILEEQTLSEQRSCYFLENGDVIFIADSISKEELKNLSEKLSRYVDFLSADQMLKLYDLDEHIKALALGCEKFLQRKEDALKQEKEEEERKKQQQKEHSRMQVLDMSMDTDFEAIRKGRSGIHVLVVDDDEFSGALVSRNLSDDYNVIMAQDGETALRQYFTQAPDVVFLDIDLPDVSGHDILNKILEHDKDAFVVMLSGNSDKTNILKAIDDGAKGFIGKPFTRNKLVEYIERRS